MQRIPLRFAILSDIHGNLPALEAVLADNAPLDLSGIIVAGDMTGGMQINEVMSRLRALPNCWMIRGNNENYLARFASGAAPDWWHTALQWSLTRWNYQNLDPDHLAFVLALPEQRVIELPGAPAIRVVHGSPRRSNELVYPDVNAKQLTECLALVPEPVVIFGHTHVPWKVRQNGRLALNPGAVCSPLNGIVGAQYALLTWDGKAWQVEHRTLDYDLEPVRIAFRQSGLLDNGDGFIRSYLYDIEHGTKSLIDFLDYAFRLSSESGFADCEFVPDEVWMQASKTFAWGAEAPTTNGS